jgi:hypothetical protein
MDNKMNVCSTCCTSALTAICRHRTIRQYYEVLFSIVNTENEVFPLYDVHSNRRPGNSELDQSNQQYAFRV